MSSRLLAVTFLLLLMGFLALMALQWRLGGLSVESPQEVVVPLGGRTVVGGGRAGVEFDRRLDDRAELKVRCGSGEHWLSLRAGSKSGEVCAVRIRLQRFSSKTGSLATSRAHLEVTWGPPAGGDGEPAT